jgi:hypothetical protein
MSLQINEGSVCTQVLLRSKAELGFFHFLETVTGLAINFRWSEDPNTAWLVPATGCTRSRLLKTGFFRQVMELKIQMKNRGSALRPGLMAGSLIW